MSRRSKLPARIRSIWSRLPGPSYLLIISGLALYAAGFSSAFDFDISSLGLAVFFSSIIPPAFRAIRENIPSLNDSSNRRERDYDTAKNYEQDQDNFFLIKQRLEKQLSIMTRDAQIHLFVGILMTLGGFLVILKIQNPSEDLDIQSIINRFSLTILIEAVAVFFLQNYRLKSSAIRSYQNELTTIELREIAILASRKSRDQDPELYRTVMTALIHAERNFILRKGEKSALGEQPNQSVIEQVNALLGLLKQLENRLPSTPSKP
ncbi:MAG: hypothetical protein SF053_00570 [Bacteroidia bacterium]|nr:hypothetical protein [Bacteroidia bacterium]